MLLEELFVIKDINPGGKVFDRVSRIHCNGENYGIDLILDVNVDIYKVVIGEKLSLALSSTLSSDTDVQEEFYDPRRPTPLLNNYEYVMYGKVFKSLKAKEKDKESQNKFEIYGSFGGLLMMLKGDARHLEKLKPDTRLYLLIRKA